MMSETNLGKGLLRQEGLKPCGFSEEDQKMIQDMMAKEKRRIRLMAKVTKVSWGALGACAFLLVVLRFFWGRPASETVALSVSILYVVAAYLLFPWSIYSTIRFYLASRTATMRQIQGSLASIEKRLAALARERTGGGPAGQ